MNPTTNYVQPTITAIDDDEVCFHCHADRSHLSIRGGTEEWYIGMRCTEIHCDACDSEFVVGCDIIIEDGTLLHDHDEEFQRKWWGEETERVEALVPPTPRAV